MRREFAAPREAVFAAWTRRAADRPLVGGAHLHHARLHDGCAPGRRLEPPHAAPDGGLISEHGVYREVVAPERLVFTYSSEGGRIVDRETLVTVTFADRGGRTVLTLRHSGLPTEEARALHDGGWARCLDRFTTTLPEN